MNRLAPYQVHLRMQSLATDSWLADTEYDMLLQTTTEAVGSVLYSHDLGALTSNPRAQRPHYESWMEVNLSGPNVTQHRPRLLAVASGRENADDPHTRIHRVTYVGEASEIGELARQLAPLLSVDERVAQAWNQLLSIPPRVGKPTKYSTHSD